MRSATEPALRADVAFTQAAPGLPASTALLFAVACGMAVANVYYAQPLLDRIANEFGVSHARAGLVNTITQLGYGLGLVCLVPLGDLVERRRLIVGQMLLSALALVAVAMAPTAAVLLGAFALVGLLAVVTQVLVAHAAGLAPPAERGRVVGAVTSGIVIGILLARTVAGVLSDLAGWRSVYGVSALGMLVVAARLAVVLPRRAPVASRLDGPRLGYWRLIGSMLELFRDEPALRIRAVLAMFIFAAITTLLTPLVLPLAAPPYALSHSVIGLFGLAGAAGALGASSAGREADKGRAQRTTGIGLAIMLVAWLPVALLPQSLLWLVVGVIAMDYGLQSVHVSNQGLIYRVRPEAQSRLTAGYMVFYSIGSAAGSISSTLVYARFGWSGVSWAGAAISAAALVFWASTRRFMPEAPAAR